MAFVPGNAEQGNFSNLLTVLVLLPLTPDGIFDLMRLIKSKLLMHYSKNFYWSTFV